MSSGAGNEREPEQATVDRTSVLADLPPWGQGTASAEDVQARRAAYHVAYSEGSAAARLQLDDGGEPTFVERFERQQLIDASEEIVGRGQSAVEELDNVELSEYAWSKSYLEVLYGSKVDDSMHRDPVLAQMSEADVDGVLREARQGAYVDSYAAGSAAALRHQEQRAAEHEAYGGDLAESQNSVEHRADRVHTLDESELREYAYSKGYVETAQGIAVEDSMDRDPALAELTQADIEQGGPRLGTSAWETTGPTAAQAPPAQQRAGTKVAGPSERASGLRARAKALLGRAEREGAQQARRDGRARAAQERERTIDVTLTTQPQDELDRGH